MDELRRLQAEAEVAYAAERRLAVLLKENKGLALTSERQWTPEMIWWELKGITHSALYQHACSEEEINGIDRESIVRAAMGQQGITVTW